MLYILLQDTSDTIIVRTLGLPWWIVWYQFLLLVAITVLAIMGHLRASAIVLGNFLAAAFALQAYIASTASNLVMDLKDVRSHSAALLTSLVIPGMSDKMSCILEKVLIGYKG
jgi:hypothetical protein